MALKAIRKYGCGEDEGSGVFFEETPSTSCNALVAERGLLLVYKATADPAWTGTGKPGQAGNAVGVVTAVAEIPFGLLLMDVYKVDQTKFAFSQDQYSLATTVCKPVKSIRSGSFCTDWIVPADLASILPGESVYFNTLGFTNVNTLSAVVGTFGGVADADGFVLIKFDIK